MEKIERQRRLITFLVKTKAPKWFLDSEKSKLEDMILEVIGGNE